MNGMQLELAKRALNWPKMNRNHYAAALGTEEEIEWDRMVDEGFALVEHEQGLCKIYAMTDLGKSAVWGFGEGGAT